MNQVFDCFQLNRPVVTGAFISMQAEALSASVLLTEQSTISVR